MKNTTKASVLPVLGSLAVVVCISWVLISGQVKSTKELVEERGRVAAAVSASASTSSSDEDIGLKLFDGTLPPVYDTEPEPEPMQELIITNEGYAHVPGKTGRDWLKAIGTVKLTGDVRDAEIDFDLSRGNDDRGWAGLGMYFAKPTENGGIDPETEWRHVRYIGAFWNGIPVLGADGKPSGTCKRLLDPDSPFGVLHEHANSISYELGAILLSSDDPCNNEMWPFNLEEEINSGGAYVGFLPSAPTYNATVTIRYRGTLNVEPIK